MQHCALAADSLLAIIRASDAERAAIERVLATPDRNGLAMTPFGAITLAGSAPDAAADDNVAATLVAYTPKLDVERERATLAQRAGMLEHWVAGFAASDISEESPGVHRRPRRERTSPAGSMLASSLAVVTPPSAAPQPSSARSSRAQTPPPE